MSFDVRDARWIVLEQATGADLETGTHELDEHRDAVLQLANATHLRKDTVKSSKSCGKKAR